MQTKSPLSTLSWSGYLFYLCVDVLMWKTVRRWKRAAKIRERGSKTNRHLIKKTLLRKKYKPWMIWQSGFLGNLQTNTNEILHSYTSCKALKQFTRSICDLYDLITTLDMMMKNCRIACIACKWKLPFVF